MAVLALFAACNAYDQALIDGAFGGRGSAGAGALGGAVTGGGTGGDLAGQGGSLRGGASGAGGGAGGAQGGGGSNGEAGEGDTGSGGASGDGQGGASGSDTGGTSGANAGAGIGGASGGGAGDAVGGDAGMAGGGAGSGGAGAGGAGMGGTGDAGSGGAGEVCTGCARLSVPLAAATDQAHFTLTLPQATDFSAATISMRIARYAGSGGWFKTYIQEGAPDYGYQDSPETPIASITTSMQTIEWDVSTAGTGADKTIISRVGFEISGAGASSWTNPTVLYLDSVTITGTSLSMASFPFDTASEVSTTPTSNGPSNVIWLNNYSGDTNVEGASLGWLGP